MKNIGQCIIISRKIYQDKTTATIYTVYKMSLVISMSDGLVVPQSPAELIEVQMFLK